MRTSMTSSTKAKSCLLCPTSAWRGKKTKTTPFIKSINEFHQFCISGWAASHWLGSFANIRAARLMIPPTRLQALSSFARGWKWVHSARVKAVRADCLSHHLLLASVTLGGSPEVHARSIWWLQYDYPLHHTNAWWCERFLGQYLAKLGLWNEHPGNLAVAVDWCCVNPTAG